MCSRVTGRIIFSFVIWTEAEKDLYKEVYDSLYAGIAEMKPGNTTKDVAEKFPKYADDKYGIVSLQQFAHSIGLDLYEVCGFRELIL